MSLSLGRWVLALDGSSLPAREHIGGKAWSIARMRSLGLNVPPAFVVTAQGCTHFLETGQVPAELASELAQGIAWLEAQTGRSFGHGPSPLLVSVRSGAAISMPGMMDTVLNLGTNDDTERALGEECADPAFARDTHRRFLDLFASIVLRVAVPEFDHQAAPEQWRAAIARAAGAEVPQDVTQQLQHAVQAVFESWNSRRARRYRQHHGISDSLGTAVTVQAMVFGNLDAQSGTGVLFSRNPLTGEPTPYGEYLPRAQGEDVVSGKYTPRPLSEMQANVPEACAQLLAAAQQLEDVGGDIQDIEFTVERGRLYLLQARAAKRAPAAAVRAAVEMVGEGRIDVASALRRVTPEQLATLLSPRLAPGAAEEGQVCAKGEGACPGVAAGCVVDDPDEAERRAAAGEAVVLARATTSPNDVHGMIAARAVITEQGGSTSHAAVVSRALGRPCVVGCGDGSLRALVSTQVTVDGQAGRIYQGLLPVVTPSETDDEWLQALAQWATEHSVLQVHAPTHAVLPGLVDLSGIAGAEDPQHIAELLKGFPEAKGAQGGAIATPEGLRAARAQGLEYVVAAPRLPTLLAAAQMTLQEAETH